MRTDQTYQAGSFPKSTVLLSYGMGVDSTAILLRWIKEPETRQVDGVPFELEDLVVLTAQTGNEFADTGRHVTDHVLPLLRENGIRFVEVARKTKSQTDGYVVLQDTSEPVELHLEGGFKLSDELQQAGTIPASGGVHLCSIKSKGQVLDCWIEDEVDGPYLHAIGYNADETKRADRDVDARAKKGTLLDGAAYRIAFGFNADETKRADRGTEARAKKNQGAPFFPLIEWGWTYKDCSDFIAKTTGIEWRKSCCSFCPFAGGRAPILERYRQDPAAAAEALMLEHGARALNPRMLLYKTKSLVDIVAKDGNTDALELHQAELDQAEWAVYRVRRIWWAKGRASRSVKVLETGTRSEMTEAVAELGAVKDDDGFDRVIVSAKPETHEGREEFFVAAVKQAVDKDGRKNFEELWRAAR
jgi:hypothetical protein